VDALGRLAADAACGCPLRGLILTGGDTARSVCQHLGVSGIHLLAEVQPGVPLGRLVGNSAVQLLAVTKAGAFGSERTLLDALDRLKLDRLKGEM
jgi:D-threonate/D-erythronate kinase